jgi:hypothetical protein
MPQANEFSWVLTARSWKLHSFGDHNLIHSLKKKRPFFGAAIVLIGDLRYHK